MSNSLSVIIPSLNRKKFVLDLLGDLSRQTRPADEIIVIDQSREPYYLENCVYVSMPDKLGPCLARNVGIKKATGDILVFLDDDICILPTFLEKITRPILNNEFRVVVGAITDGNGNFIPPYDQFLKANTPWWITAITANPSYPGKRPTLSFAAGCSAVHSSVFSSIGLFDTFFDPDGAGEDRELAIRMYEAGISILYNGDARIVHLADTQGGRRAISRGKVTPNQNMNFDICEFTPLEKNIVYIIAKHFSKQVFRSHCRSWLGSIILDRITWNPTSWIRVSRRYRAAIKWIDYVQSIFP